MSDQETSLLEANEFRDEQHIYTQNTHLESPQYKVIYIHSNFTKTESQENKCCNFFRKCCGHTATRNVTNISDCTIDGISLTNDLSYALQIFEKEGYSLKSITPIQGGDYKITVDSGAGWSYTQGLMVVGVKI